MLLQSQRHLLLPSVQLESGREREREGGREKERGEREREREECLWNVCGMMLMQCANSVKFLVAVGVAKTPMNVYRNSNNVAWHAGGCGLSC